VSIRVLIAEDNVLLRDGLSRLIAATPDLELAGSCGSLDELLECVAAGAVDVVVTDIRMPPTGTDEGIRAAAAIRGSHPSVGVVVLSQYASPAYALALLEGGSDRRAYLLKDRVADVDDLVAAIRTVAAGGAVIDPKVVELLVSSSRQRSRSPIEFLTPREREILGEMARAVRTRRSPPRCTCRSGRWRSTSTRSSRSSISPRSVTSIDGSPPCCSFSVRATTAEAPTRTTMS
jgi:DNA-binding NarL/FixJ family response regulator